MDRRWKYGCGGCLTLIVGFSLLWWLMYRVDAWWPATVAQGQRGNLSYRIESPRLQEGVRVTVRTEVFPSSEFEYKLEYGPLKLLGVDEQRWLAKNQVLLLRFRYQYQYDSVPAEGEMSLLYDARSGQLKVSYGDWVENGGRGSHPYGLKQPKEFVVTKAEIDELVRGLQ
jgi:hypothetical protein